MKKEYLGKIEQIEKIAKDCYKMTILSDLQNVYCGQFISILCKNKTIRRPFSIADFEKEANQSLTTILFKIKGQATSYLSSLKTGDSVDFLAPLGNGFEISNEKALLIGAGIGIAPLLFLKKELNKRNIDNFLISGFKSQEEVIKGSDRTIIGGTILDYIEETIISQKPKVVYCCAPTIVLKGADEITKKHNLKTYLSLEKVMACSIGVCRGCVIKLIKNNKIANYCVCKDGPVFLGGEIIWE